MQFTTPQRVVTLIHDSYESYHALQVVSIQEYWTTLKKVVPVVVDLGHEHCLIFIYVFRVMLSVVPCLAAMVVNLSSQLHINRMGQHHHTRVMVSHSSRVRWGPVS